jgi:RNA polymerase sigma factor (sigma-70 family)
MAEALEEKSFDELVERFYQPLFRFGLSLAKDEAEASDLVQQTFLLWGTKGHQLRDRSKVKSWLFTTLHREFLGGLRRRNRFEHHEMSQVEHELPNVASTVVNDLDGDSAMEGLQEVDEIFRVPLTLFYIEQHSYKDISEILGVPLGTVMSRLARGKVQLRRLLADKLKRRENKTAI